MVFPVVMYGCETWTIKKAEHQRTDAFKLWCWRRLLRVPCRARSLNQSFQPWIFIGRTVTEIQYFGHRMRRADSLEKTLLMGKGATEHEMVRQQHWLNGHELEQILGDSEGQGRLVCCSLHSLKELDMTERLNSSNDILGLIPNTKPTKAKK